MQVAIGSESSAVQYLNYATGKLGASVHVTSPMVYSIRPVGSEVRLVGCLLMQRPFVACSHSLLLILGCLASRLPLCLEPLPLSILLSTLAVFRSAFQPHQH